MSVAPGGLRTPSLRRRVTLVAVALVALVLIVLVVATDLVLRQRLDDQLRERLVDRTSVADALDGQVDDRDLVRRLEGQGVSAVLTTSDGETFAEGPLAGAAGVRPDSGGGRGTAPSEGPDGAPAPRTPPGPVSPPGAQPTVQQSGHLLSVSHRLDDGSTLVLLADASEVDDTVGQVRLVLLVASGLVLLLTAAVVPLVVGRTLRPLETITGVARSITRGDRGRRLHPVRPGTDLGRTAAAFDDMLDEVVGAEDRAVASEARLRDFLSDAAHELRTPVAGIQASAEHLLRDDPDRAHREAALVALIRETRRAGRLVDELLLMARIDRGLDLAHDRLSVTELVAEAVGVRRHRSPGLTWVAPEPTDGAAGAAGAAGTAYVVGDRDRLLQVLANLLDNAARAAGPTGRVEVRLSVSPLLAAGPAEGPAVVLDVLDDGPGVPEADRERIFERLVRLDASRTHPGSGLGLSIARGIARAHGGDLVCLAPSASVAAAGAPPTTAGATGALFRLTLPAASVTLTPRPAPPPYAPGAVAQPVRAEDS